jgi:hypothetical protein
MTLHEWKKFKSWIETKKTPVKGYIVVYPSGIKYIKNPSSFMLEESRKNHICFFPEDEFKLENDNLVAKSRKYTGDLSTPKIRVPFNHIKEVHIYDYNC